MHFLASKYTKMYLRSGVCLANDGEFFEKMSGYNQIDPISNSPVDHPIQWILTSPSVCTATSKILLDVSTDFSRLSAFL